MNGYQPHPQSCLILAQSRSPDHISELLFLDLILDSQLGISSNTGLASPRSLRYTFFLLPSVYPIKSLSPSTIWPLSQPGMPGILFDLCSLKLTAIVVAEEEKRATPFVLLDQLTQSFSKDTSPLKLHQALLKYHAVGKTGSPAQGPPCVPHVPTVTLGNGRDHKSGVL